LNHEGRKRRHVRGHAPKKHRDRPDVISHSNQKETIQLIFEVLPTTAGYVNTVTTIAKKTGINRETILHNLEIIDLVFELQPGRWLEAIKVEGMKNVSNVFRRGEAS